MAVIRGEHAKIHLNGIIKAAKVGDVIMLPRDELWRLGSDVVYESYKEEDIVSNPQSGERYTKRYLEIEDYDMPDSVQHEIRRFREMTQRQLWTRLGKITNAQKLKNFIILAQKNGYRGLEIAAKGRLFELTGEEVGIIEEEEQETKVRYIDI